MKCVALLTGWSIASAGVGTALAGWPQGALAGIVMAVALPIVMAGLLIAGAELIDFVRWEILGLDRSSH